MIKLIRRTRLPDIKLPFYPRSAGMNSFTNPGIQEDMEGIDAVEICTLVQGICEVEQRGKMVTLTPGESLYKLPGEHRKKIVLSPGGAKICWVTFDGERAADFMQSYAYEEGPLKSGPGILQLYEEIANGLIEGSPNAYRKMIALYAKLIGSLLDEIQSCSNETGMLALCLRSIRKNFNDESFNVDALSQEMKLHRSTLLRIFRRELNMTPSEYLQQCRLEYALYLLRTTLLPVAEIAKSSGFHQCNYFCKVIRSRCGKSPEEYRKRLI